jgi:hypothetical protein
MTPYLPSLKKTKYFSTQLWKNYNFAMQNPKLIEKIASFLGIG